MTTGTDLITGGKVRDILIEILTRSTEGRVDLSIEDGPTALRGLGLNFLALLSFLVAVEDEFGIVWHDEILDEVFQSIESIAGYITEQLDPARK